MSMSTSSIKSHTQDCTLPKSPYFPQKHTFIYWKIFFLILNLWKVCGPKEDRLGSSKVKFINSNTNKINSQNKSFIYSKRINDWTRERFVALKRAVGIKGSEVTQLGRALQSTRMDLSTFTTDTTSELNILGHDGNPFGVNGAKVGIFEKTDEIGFCCFLEGKDSRRLESEKRKTWEYIYNKGRGEGVTYRRSVLKSWAISRTKRWNGSLRMRSSVDFW